MLGMKNNPEMKCCGSVKGRGAKHDVAGRVDGLSERCFVGEGRMSVLAAYCGCNYFVGRVHRNRKCGRVC